MSFLAEQGSAKEVIEYVLDAVKEGEAFLAAQFGYKDIDRSTAYIQGEPTFSIRRRGLSQVSVNLVGKVVGDNVAALTDIKPYFSYRTANPTFKDQAEILNNLAQSWWMNNFIDLKIAGAVQLAMPAGCSYLQFVWNPELQGGKGDLDVIPRDCRDVIPIRPTSSISIQDSLGVIIKGDETVAYLRQRYPHLSKHIVQDKDLAFSMGRTITPSGAIARFVSPIMARLKRGQRKGGPILVPGKEVFTMHIKDDRLNETNEEVAMGFDHQGERMNWSYIVKPGQPLYPRGRTVVCAEDMVFYDGPNIWLFDTFPLIKLYMDMSFVYSDSYFSKAPTADLLPLNDLLTEIVRGVVDNVRKELRPNIIADMRAISRKKLEAFDSRLGGQKLRVRPVGSGKAIEFIGGVELKKYVFEMMIFAREEIRELSGSNDLSALTKLKQIPAKESIEQLIQSMSPQVRMRGRLLEFTIRELAHMLKFGFFQWYSAPRRMAILGPDGLSLEDFDFDPGSLIPDGKGFITDVSGKRAQFDDFAGLPKIQRAIKHASNFTFYVTPNSMLEMQLLSKKAEAIMLRKMGEIDHDTFLEIMEVANIPSINKKLSSEIDQKIAAAQQLEAGSAGRPQTLQQTPSVETKGGGAKGIRATVTTS